MEEKKTENLYFIAIIPPEPLYTETLTLKNHFKDQYNSKAALNSPPHITLHMPFKWRATKETELVSSLEKFSAKQKPFEIRLTGFGSFEQRVIFLDVKKDEKLELLQKQLKRFCKVELNLFNADYREFAYHPHITLAFRDLKKAAFYKAWEELKEKKLEANFTLGSIALLKHNGKVWNVFKDLLLLAK